MPCTEEGVNAKVQELAQAIEKLAERNKRREERGEGELTHCPKCGSEDLTYTDEEHSDYGYLEKFVRCQACDSEFFESWICKGWEEWEDD